MMFITWFLLRVSGEDDRLNKWKKSFNAKSQLNLLFSSLLPICVSTGITHTFYSLKENPFSVVVNLVNAAAMFLGVLVIPAYVIYTHRKLKWTGYEQRLKQEISNYKKT